MWALLYRGPKLYQRMPLGNLPWFTLTHHPPAPTVPVNLSLLLPVCVERFIRDDAQKCNDCGSVVYFSDDYMRMPPWFYETDDFKAWEKREPPKLHELNEARVKVAFDMIAKANTVTILSLGEMEAVVNRALKGEFDSDVR